jgi:hypothetical protein
VLSATPSIGDAMQRTSTLIKRRASLPAPKKAAATTDAARTRRASANPVPQATADVAERRDGMTVLGEFSNGGWREPSVASRVARARASKSAPTAKSADAPASNPVMATQPAAPTKPTPARTPWSSGADFNHGIGVFNDRLFADLQRAVVGDAAPRDVSPTNRPSNLDPAVALGGAAGAFVSRVAGPRAPKTAAQRRRRLVRNRWAVARVLSANPSLRLQRGGVAAQAPSDYDWAADEQRHHLDANCRLDDGKGHARTIATLIDEQHAIIAEGSRSERLTSERTSERQDVAPPVAPVAPPPRTATTVEDDPPKRMSVKDRLAMFGG